MADQSAIDAAKALLDACLRKKLTLATAESCTGGLVAATISEIPGSSAVLDRGFVTYSNEAKEDLLGVSASTLKRFGAVSEEVARAMARGALEESRATLAVAVTGIAGPGGATPGKPVGLVWIAWARKGEVRARRFQFKGGRAAVRRQAVAAALEGLTRE